MASRITVTLHELVSALDARADAMLRARYGVGFSHVAFLVAVSEEQPVDITHLAQCLGVTKAAVSKRVPGLVAEGWITTSADPANARRVIVSLTPRGSDLVEHAGGEVEAWFRSLFADERVADIDGLNAQLGALAELVLAEGARA
jgi:DNA-binding MarR family transcriptional regulator